MTDIKRQQTKIKRKTQRRNSLLKMTEMSTNTLKALDGANGKKIWQLCVSRACVSSTDWDQKQIKLKISNILKILSPDHQIVTVPLSHCECVPGRQSCVAFFFGRIALKIFED